MARSFGARDDVNTRRYASDDINKFLWMVRIGGGVFPHIKESDYNTPQVLSCVSQGCLTVIDRESSVWIRMLRLSCSTA